MKFKVSKISDIICDGCGGTTRVAPNNTYSIDDLTCMCIPEGELFGRDEIKALVDKPKEKVSHSNSNARVAQEIEREHPNQVKMFEEEPENVFEEETMSREQVAEYLGTLKWQKLLESARNNGIAKQPNIKRVELEQMILEKVFGDADVVSVEQEQEDG